MSRHILGVLILIGGVCEIGHVVMSASSTGTSVTIGHFLRAVAEACIILIAHHYLRAKQEQLKQEQLLLESFERLFQSEKHIETKSDEHK